MADSVGKISLDIDVSSALDKEIKAKSDQIGKSMSSSIKKSFESSTQGFKKTLQNIFSFPKRQFDQQVKSAQKTLQDNLKMPKEAFQMPKQTFNASPFFDANDQLSQSLNNVNQQIEIQQQKLAQLKQQYNEGLSDNVKHQIEQQDAIMKSSELRIEGLRSKLQELQHSYDVTVNPDRKNKLVGEIAKTEAQMTTLIARSDNALHKIQQLEDGFGRESKNALREKIVRTESSLINLGKRAEKIQADMNGTNQSFNRVASSATKTEKPVRRLGFAFFGAGKQANVMTNSFVRGFKRIAKQVLVFSVLYRGIRTLQQYMGSAMNTNAQFVHSLNQIKTNLQVAFMPIFDVVMPALQSFMNWLAKITAYIAAFISALFGKTYRESYQAAQGLNSARAAMDAFGSSSKKAAKEAKEANKQLASFDEINTIANANNMAGSGAPGAGVGGIAPLTPPDIDVSGIQAKMDKLASGIRKTFSSAWDGIIRGWRWTTDNFGPALKNAWDRMKPELESWKGSFGQVFDDIKSLGGPLANWFQNDVVPLWNNGVSAATGILLGFSESVRMVFDGIWSAVYPILEKFVVEGLPRMTEFVDGAIPIYQRLFDTTKGIFDDIWQVAVQPAMDQVSGIVQDGLDGVFASWDTWGTDILSELEGTFDGVEKLWKDLWEVSLKPQVDFMLSEMNRLWDEHLADTLGEFTSFVGNLITNGLKILNQVILPMASWLSKILSPSFTVAFGLITNTVSTAIELITGYIRGYMRSLGGLIDFITGVFTGDWKKAWNGIKDFFGGWGDSLQALFKAPINGIIGTINSFIRGLNKVKLPSWVPGFGGRGFSVPEIPRLAKGGIIDQPTIAMVGEAGKEAVMPLENNTGWINNLAGQIANQMGGQSNASDESVTILREIVNVLMQILNALLNSETEAVFKLGETEFGRAVIKAINNLQTQSGKTLIKV